MYGHCTERVGCNGGGRAADARRPHMTTSRFVGSSCPLIRLRCSVRARKAAEQRLGRARNASDAVTTPAVITEVVASTDVLLNDSDEAPRATFEPRSASTSDAGADSSSLLSEQLDSRRLSNLSASSSTSSIDGDAPLELLRNLRPQQPNGRNPQATTVTDGSPLWPAATTRGSPVTPTTFPTFPRPSTSTAAVAVGPSSPLPPAVPAAAAQLYAGSSVAGNLSVTDGSSDVLVPLLDWLQLEPPAPAGPGGPSNAQRVYKSATTAVPASSDGGTAAGSSAAGGTAAPPALVRRKRAQVRVLDTSELLLARDEAVRTELLGRTWKDLLRFDERMGTGPQTAEAETGGHQQHQHESTAAAQAAPSLEEVLEFMQQRAAAMRDEDQQEAGAGEEDAGPSLEARLLGNLEKADSWKQLRRLYLKHRATFSTAHLTVTLQRLSRFYNQEGAVYKRDRVAFYALWDTVLEQVAFTAPDLAGPQAVAVVGAMASLPFNFGPRVQSTLLTMQRVLRYSQHSVVPQATTGMGAGGAGPGGSGGGVILNANQVVAGRRGGAAGASASRSAGNAPGQGLQPFTSPPGMAGPGMAGGSPSSGPAGGAMRGYDYALLAYLLGRVNSRVRPFRMSLRLPPSFTRGLLVGSYAALGSLSPRDCSRLLYGLACLRAAPPAPWLFGFYPASARGLSSMSDVELTMLMYGACRLPIKPPPQWIEACLDVVARRLGQLDAAGLVGILHSLGRLKYKPRGAWLGAHMAASQAALASGSMDPGEMSQLLRGLAFLGVEPEEELWEELWEASGRAMERAEASPAQLANLAWSLGQLKVPIPRRWYEQLLVQMRRNHEQLRPYHRRRLLAALHAFGCRDLQRWYELLRVPVEEMPGYQEVKASQAALRVQQAKVQLLAERRQQQQMLQQGQPLPQAQGPALPAPSPPPPQQQQEKVRQKTPQNKQQAKVARRRALKMGVAWRKGARAAAAAVAVASAAQPQAA